MNFAAQQKAGGSFNPARPARVSPLQREAGNVAYGWTDGGEASAAAVAAAYPRWTCWMWRTWWGGNGDGKVMQVEVLAKTTYSKSPSRKEQKD